MNIVLCEESPYDLIKSFGTYSVFLQLGTCYKVELTYIPFSRKKTRTIITTLRSLGLQLELESFKSRKYPCCHEFSKVNIFFGGIVLPNRWSKVKP